MFLKILIFCIGIHLNTAQIINHHLPAGHDGSNENLNWPSLNIIMHVPNENGTLKKVPIYQDPATSRRLQMQQQQQQLLNNRNRGGRYYSNSNHRNGTSSSQASMPPVQTEWVMGKPPGVRFNRPPGVDYKTFRPGQVSPPNVPNTDWTHDRMENLTLPAARFNARRTNKNLTMNMDVAIHPIPEEYTLEHISRNNQSHIMFNHTEPDSGEYDSDALYQSRRPFKSHRKHRTKLTTHKKLYTGNVLRKPFRNGNPTRQIEEFSGNIAGFTKLLNDSLYSMNNNQRVRPATFVEVPYGSYMRNRGYQNNYEQERQRVSQLQKQMYHPRIGRNRFYQGYQTNQRRDTQLKYPEDDKLFFSGLDSIEPQNQSYNYSFGGGQSSLTPIFWDGNSPMNISITQRDPQNNTIFSYTFDPNILVHSNNDTSYSGPLRNFSRPSLQPKKIYHRLEPFYTPRNKVKDAKEASKIWKTISGRYNNTTNFEPYSVTLDNFENIENNLKPEFQYNNKNGPMKISLDDGATSSGGAILYGDESMRNVEENSELLGYFPKHLSSIFESKKYSDTPPLPNPHSYPHPHPPPADETKMNLRKFYSSISKTMNPKDKEELVLTGVDQDEYGNYMYQSLESNDRKSPLDDSNNMLVITPAPYASDSDSDTVSTTTTDKTNKYILMQLKKPNTKSKTSKSDFKSKVEPLIITSIYRQFLTDLKKNTSHDGSAKHKLHFSFKLGPGYFNKELVKPKSAVVDESFDFDDEKYDSHQYFHD